jgi:ferredoxin
VNEPDVLKAIDSEFQKKIVIACYPRAVKNMLKQGGVDFGEFEVLNFKELTAVEIFSQLKEKYQIKEGKALFQKQISGLEVPAWFPVIDESRCTLCGKCARFCLFGVYTFDKKSLKVINPLACKDKCPACGRTCPTSAIMFPRLAENTVLAGDEPGNKKMTVDTGSLLMTLNARNQNRRNIFRQGVVEQAEEERRKALEELKATLSKKN